MPSPKRLTAGTANDQLLYFTSTSLSADDNVLVFISDRSGQVNLHALERQSGQVRQLSDNKDGYLRSYVYFDGLPYRGLGLASPCFHAVSGDLYYLQGRELRCVNVYRGNARTLAILPEDHVTGFTHVSNDNSRVCVPTIHASAFRDTAAIDKTVQALGLSSFLHVFDTASGAEASTIEIPRGWVTHVQFRPGSSETILFNHEWPDDCGVRRLWLWDGQEARRLRPEGQNVNGSERRRDDWVCHEVWSRDGRFIIYHGSYARGPMAGRSFVGRVSPIGEDHTEIAFAPEFTRYGHFSLGNTGNMLVSDGYYRAEDDDGDAKAGSWISLLDVDWAQGAHAWTPLCRHGSSWTSQDAHPHPVFNHAGTEVLFTSDRSGRRAVYGLDVRPYL